MADAISVPPSNLVFDETNPRLPVANEGQRETMRALAKLKPRKVLRLAEDIVANGMNPADLPIVMPGEDNRYIVLEGNRRLVALRALENPDSFAGALDGGTLDKMRTLSRTYLDSPIDLVQCCLVKTRDDAEHWITLRHTGENDGAGIIPWGSDETSRFRARSGSKDISTQAMDFLQRQGELTAEERAKVPATSLKRLLGTPAVRVRLGLGFEKGELTILADQKKVAKALKFVTQDLASPTGTKVKDIYQREQREKYAQKIPSTVAVTTTAKSGPSIESATAKAEAKVRKTKKPAAPKKRDHLISNDCVLTIAQSRIRAIERELRLLSLESHTNAVSVLFRVFVELSMDEYIDKHSLTVTAHDKLRVKIQKTVEHLLSLKKLNEQQVKPVRRALAKDSYLAPSLDLMNDYIHNQDAPPAPSDLRAYWDSLQPFMTAVWSV